VPRRPFLVAAVGLALAAPLGVTDALSTGEVEAFEHATARAAHVPSAYEVARRRGQPVAVLTRATLLRASPDGRRIAKLRRRTEFGTPTVLAAVGERDGWLRVMARQLPNGRTGWIAASAAGIVASPWSLRADLSKRLVTVLRGGRVARRLSVGIGKPSTPTPTGRFAITDKLHFTTRSPAYGCCAIALTGRQPRASSGWRGGLRLAIHGTGAPGSIGQAASAGCLRAHDADVRWLVRHAYLGSIVEISP
jgi:lipoprotein-anchoring transpeptidase ErfK/SrfK